MGADEFRVRLVAVILVVVDDMHGEHEGAEQWCDDSHRSETPTYKERDQTEIAPEGGHSAIFRIGILLRE